MKYHRKYEPYIRRLNGRERATSLRIAIRLAAAALLPRSQRPYYVMVQRGFPNAALAIGTSREEIKQSILWLRGNKRKTFRDWAKLVRDAARNRGGKS